MGDDIFGMMKLATQFDIWPPKNHGPPPPEEPVVDALRAPMVYAPYKCIQAEEMYETVMATMTDRNRNLGEMLVSPWILRVWPVVAIMEDRMSAAQLYCMPSTRYPCSVSMPGGRR